jgi:hypothetical protein
MTKVVKKRLDPKVARLIAAAVERISDSHHREIHVSIQRARRKAHSMRLSDRQRHLLNYIRGREFVTDIESLGMNWNILGPLRNRGLIERAQQDGEWGIKAVRSAYGL